MQISPLVGYLETMNVFLAYAYDFMKLFLETVHDRRCFNRSIEQTEHSRERSFVKRLLNSF